MPWLEEAFGVRLKGDTRGVHTPGVEGRRAHSQGDMLDGESVGMRKGEAWPGAVRQGRGEEGPEPRGRECQSQEESFPPPHTLPGDASD